MEKKSNPYLKFAAICLVCIILVTLLALAIENLS